MIFPAKTMQLPLGNSPHRSDNIMISFGLSLFLTIVANRGLAWNPLLKCENPGGDYYWEGGRI